MPVFRFRAQPALDLRRREQEAAQRELARADAERQRAQARVGAAERALADATRGADAAVPASGMTRIDWYRSWLLRLERERAALSEALQGREAVVVQARASALAVRRRCEALERLRAKAYQMYLAADAAAERKTIDEAAAQRHARRAITEGA